MGRVTLDDVTSVLCLGAHCDDIEIGAGATILRLVDERPDVHVTWVVFSSTLDREREARASAAEFLAEAAHHQIEIHRFTDGFFPAEFAAIKGELEILKERLQPDLVFTHQRDDRHQDHRVVSDLTWNTFRHHLVLEYEVPRYDGDLGQPNVFIPVDARLAERKTELLMRHYTTQRDKHWFTPETFKALMRIRGVECRASEGFAEAFYGRKLTI
ncbi:MAG: PIG-L deacetylase family protein [Vicinamibacterales bacterium]